MKKASSGAPVSIYLSEQNSCCMQPTYLILMMCSACMRVCVCKYSTWIRVCLRPAKNFTCFCPKLGRDRVEQSPAEPDRRAAFPRSPSRFGNTSWGNVLGESSAGDHREPSRSFQNNKAHSYRPEGGPGPSTLHKGELGRSLGSTFPVRTEALGRDGSAGSKGSDNFLLSPRASLLFFFFSLLLIVSWEFNAYAKTPLSIICGTC